MRKKTLCPSSSGGLQMDACVPASTGNSFGPLDGKPSTPLDPCVQTGIPSPPKLDRDERDDLGCCLVSARNVELLKPLVQTPPNCRKIQPTMENPISKASLPHDAHSYSQAGLAAVDVVPKSNEFLLAESATIERPVGDEVPLVGEIRVIDCDSDVVSSQSSED
ncbi:hypothetical protein Nepgr_002792 [Nepenthes gracilis]|uniref:Uncharacterized protein n=1 Tax=Nepenthes gracilis TaxID=150966 RepID=A0AAD3P995_NEPGR|nr:hypothetical protein Nepgr_002792 [Nepenthes gracilis]